MKTTASIAKTMVTKTMFLREELTVLLHLPTDT